METNNRSSIEFFDLATAGQSANVRLLYTTTQSLTSVITHRINNAGKTKRVKCLGENCPCCKAGIPQETRLVLHLYDYTDGKEKIWNRTNNQKFVQAIADIEQSWGNLCDIPLRITRESQEFPTYAVTPLPPQQFPKIEGLEINKDCSFRMGLYRSASELEEALRTGVVPPHVKNPPMSVPGAGYTQTPYAPQPTTPAYTAPQQNAGVNYHQQTQTAPAANPYASYAPQASAPAQPQQTQAYTASQTPVPNIYSETPTDDDLPF